MKTSHMLAHDMIEAVAQSRMTIRVNEWCAEIVCGEAEIVLDDKDLFTVYKDGIEIFHGSKLSEAAAAFNQMVTGIAPTTKGLALILGTFAGLPEGSWQIEVQDNLLTITPYEAQ